MDVETVIAPGGGDTGISGDRVVGASIVNKRINRSRVACTGARGLIREFLSIEPEAKLLRQVKPRS